MTSCNWARGCSLLTWGSVSWFSLRLGVTAALRYCYPARTVAVGGASGEWLSHMLPKLCVHQSLHSGPKLINQFFYQRVHGVSTAQGVHLRSGVPPVATDASFVNILDRICSGSSAISAAATTWSDPSINFCPVGRDNSEAMLFPSHFTPVHQLKRSVSSRFIHGVTECPYPSPQGFSCNMPQG